MKRYQLLKVDSPLVEIECGGTVVRTQPIKDASKDPNFPDPIISFDVVCDSSCSNYFKIHTCCIICFYSFCLKRIYMLHHSTFVF